MLLVTTSHSLLRVDADSGDFEPLHRPRLYFGVANDGERWFVAARAAHGLSASRRGERGCILVFDKAPRRGAIAAPFPMRDMHETLWNEGKLWVTCSFDNMTIYESSARWEGIPSVPRPPPTT